MMCSKPPLCDSIVSLAEVKPDSVRGFFGLATTQIRRTRFCREAAMFRHPNICPVHDVGEIEGQHYITMAFIEGRPLSNKKVRDADLILLKCLKQKTY